MRNAMTTAMARQIASLFDGGSVAGLSDRQLIDRFGDGRDPLAAEAAFAALVARHGPMVLSVCGQLLGDRQHAEDAFQAVFLVLARRARSLRDPDRLGPWLHGVALRTARKARGRLARVHRAEQAGARTEASDAATAEHPAIDREHAEALHDEVDRLPAASRLPVVLCYFEGLSLAEAAERLRCPAGTVHSRLVRARERLRRGLARRGVMLSTAALSPRPAPVPPLLCDSTTKAAIAFAARHAPDGMPAAAIAREVLRSMLLHKLKLATMALLLLGGVAVAFAAPREDQPPVEPRSQAAPTDPDRPASGRMLVVGRVLDPQGKPVPGASVMVHAALRQPGRMGDHEQLMPAPIGRARCDAAGHFRLDAPRITSARYYFAGAVATAPGYGAGWDDLDADADRPAVEITLRPEQFIEGRVFDLVGRPVAGVRVEVLSLGLAGPPASEGPRLWWSHGQERTAWPGPATSDDQGRFTLRGIGQGVRARLGIDDPRFARWRTTIDTDDAAGTRSLTIALEPARVIAGRITDAETGEPIPHARLIVMSHKGSAGTVDQFEADDRGGFRVNPLSADRYSLSVYPPPGRPNLGGGTEIFTWPKGALEHRVDVSLRRGVVIPGKVVEEGTGRPIAGARISFASPRRADRASGSSNGSVVSAEDGSFRLAVLPAPGYLVVVAPSDDYAYRSAGTRMLLEGEPGGRRMYAHAFVAHDPKPGGPEVTVPLRRGGTVQGRIIGPDGRTIPEAAMIARVFPPPYHGPYRPWRYDPQNRVRDGRFEIHGLDPDAEVPIHFLDPKARLGVTAMLSGRSGSGSPVTVRLEPCGTARARLVDGDGRPVAGHRGARMVSIVVQPGATASGTDRPREVLAVEAIVAAIDPAHYGDDLVSDADGRIAWPDLIPGAAYCVRVRDRNHRITFQKEFTVKPGETIDLGTIVVERPST